MAIRSIRLPQSAGVMTACLLICACSTIGIQPPKTPTASDPAAVNIVADLNRSNAGLKTFKGIGRVKLFKNNTVRVQERMAWVGSAPSRLSVVVFASGRPALKLATDGKRLYVLDLYASQRPFYETRAVDSGLKRLMQLPVKPGEMVTLLRGRLPLAAYQTASLEPDPAGGGVIVSLKKRARTLQKIYLGQADRKVQKFEVFNNRGKLLYRAEFDAYRHVQDYQVPFELILSDDDGNRMHLAIDRYLADVRVQPSMFVLEPPEK